MYLLEIFTEMKNREKCHRKILDSNHHKSIINEYKRIKLVSLGIDEVYVLEAKDI